MKKTIITIIFTLVTLVSFGFTSVKPKEKKTPIKELVQRYNMLSDSIAINQKLVQRVLDDKSYQYIKDDSLRKVKFDENQFEWNRLRIKGEEFSIEREQIRKELKSRGRTVTGKRIIEFNVDEYYKGLNAVHGYYYLP